MRRKTRKALIHLTLFTTILTLILYLNSPSSPTKTYPWKKVRYQTTSTTLPPSLGHCPGLSKSKKPALVVNRVSSDGDLNWLDPLKKKYHLCIYNVDAPLNLKSNELQVPANRGHEAISYLTFLIDNHDTIPGDGAVFVHGSRFAWHNDAPDYDNVPLLLDLNLPTALAEHGYANLRCDWSLSTCPPSVAAQGSFENSFQAAVAPWDARAVSDAAFPGALESIFGGKVKLSRSDAVRAQCCAQFAVSRAHLLSHSREEYIALRQWLLDGSADEVTWAGKETGWRRDPKAAPADDRVAGRILSYIWHILFMKEDEGGVDLNKLNVQACPSAEQCYCRLYGRCGLMCPGPGICEGQYTLPPGLKVPKDGFEELKL
jgi:hypothetical protein